MDYQYCHLQREEGFAVLALNRPDTGNAISDEPLLAEVLDALEQVQRSPDLPALILTGSGRFFSAGGNVKAMSERMGMFAGSPLEIYESYRRTVQRLAQAVAALDAVTIAAVNGAAMGAGCDLALMCDLRLAAQSARFAQSFVNVGLIPGDGGLWFLARSAPRHVAAELIFSGRTLDGAEAFRLGLVNECIEDDRLLERARALAAAIASRPPLAVRLGKRLLNRAYDHSLTDFLELTAAYQSMLHHTADHQEALAALLEKREGR